MDRNLHGTSRSGTGQCALVPPYLAPGPLASVMRPRPHKEGAGVRVCMYAGAVAGILSKLRQGVGCGGVVDKSSSTHSIGSHVHGCRSLASLSLSVSTSVSELQPASPCMQLASGCTCRPTGAYTCVRMHATTYCPNPR